MFEKLISWMPKSFSVLDVGGGGLHGENTTDHLVRHFDRVLCICKEKYETDIYLNQLKERGLPRPEIVNDDYYTHSFDRQFDLVVNDLNVENNLKDWYDMTFTRDHIKDGGYLIQYVMTTDQYDSEETGAHIREWSKKIWGRVPDHADIGKKLATQPGWDIIACERELRRPYITWVLLQKTNGSLR